MSTGLEGSMRNSSLTSTRPRKTYIRFSMRVGLEFTPRAKIRSLQEACNQKGRLQAELDALYERVFAGSTPGQHHRTRNRNRLFLMSISLDFPQEDEYEDRVSTTEAANYQAQSEYTQEAQTLAVLNQADEALKNCLNFIKQAKEWSTHGKDPPSSFRFINMT
jgi:hypothetical protein